MRDGGLFLKTLRGLQPIGVLLRGVDGRSVDPLELEPDGIGVPGLLAAARDHVRIVNSPGSGLAEAPALAAFLPDLATTAARRGRLRLPSVPTVWLGDAAARASVLRSPTDWRLRPAFDGASPPVPLAAMTETNRRGAARPGRRRTLAFRGERDRRALGGAVPRRRWAGAASRAGPHVPGPRPQRLARDAGRPRLRAAGRGAGVAECRAGARQGRLGAGRESRGDRGTASRARTPPLAIRRTAGDMPSRVADNFFWLGRYLERLEGAARLLRDHHRPRQPTGADAARDGGTGGADRLPRPRPGCSTPRRSPDLAPPGSARRCCASPEVGARSTPCSARCRA